MFKWLAAVIFPPPARRDREEAAADEYHDRVSTAEELDAIVDRHLLQFRADCQRREARGNR